MKTMLISALIFFSINLMANENESPIKGLTRLSPQQALELEYALITANNGNQMYGTCDLKVTSIEGVQTYINENGSTPLVVMALDNKYFIINSDETMTKIVSATITTYELFRYNVGTIIKPVYKTTYRIKSTQNCKK